LKYKKEMEKP